MLAVRNLDGRQIRDVSLDVGRGEIVGVAGLAGSGRSELLRIVGGAQQRRRRNHHVARHDGPVSAAAAGVNATTSSTCPRIDVTTG